MKYSYLMSYTCQDRDGEYSFRTAACDSLADIAGSALEVVLIAVMNLLDDLAPDQKVVAIQIAAIVDSGAPDSPLSNGNH